MSDKGWIRLDRKLLENQLWLDRPFARGQAWVDLLLTANHTGKKILLGSRSVKVQPGTVITSEAKLSERWGWGRTKTRLFLNLLESDEMIVKKTYNNRTEITIVKWGVYQVPQTAEQPANKQRINSGRTTDKQRINTNKNVNNDNNDNNVDRLVGRGGDAATAGRPTAGEVSGFVELWNGIPHTANVGQVPEGTKRHADLCKCYGLVGAEGITRAIVKVGESAYLRRKGNVRFENYMNPDAIVKLLEGYYDEDYKGSAGGDGIPFDW